MVGVCLLGVCAVAVAASVSLYRTKRDVVQSVVCYAGTTTAAADPLITKVTVIERVPWPKPTSSQYCCRFDLS